jgi:hypothetical protein
MAPEPIGWVVVTYDPHSPRPFVGFMHATPAEAQEAREGMSTSPGERHVVAGVFEMGEDGDHGR